MSGHSHTLVRRVRRAITWTTDDQGRCARRLAPCEVPQHSGLAPRRVLAMALALGAGANR